VIAYADDLMILVKGTTQVEIENYANIEVAKWARNNKIDFNGQKSKMMVITRNKPKNRRDFKLFLNNKKLQQEYTIKYLGIIIDRRFNFNELTENIARKYIKIIYALSKPAKINWGLRHDVLRIIYAGAILPILSKGAPIWIEYLKRKHNVAKLKRVQRLINIKIARAYRTTSHEALCVLTGITPIQMELRSQAKVYYITRGNAQIDAPKQYRKWTHTTKAIELKEKCEEREYTVEVYTDGSKSLSGVCSGIAISMNKHLTFQLKYKLAERCSNNQAEQLAIAKALEEIQNLSYLQGNQRSAAIHTGSKITMDAIANPRNYQNLVEQIRDAIGWLENDNWTIHFTWVKAHNNYGNELADQLAKEAASGNETDIAYNKIPKSAVIRELKEEGE